MTTTYGADPVDLEVERVLGLLRSGDVAQARLESSRVDLKEEAGRRARDGTLGVTTARSEDAAKHLAEAAACMANTDGGGALVVGVSDDGQILGTALEAEWLRSRVYDLTQRLLTVAVSEVDLDGARVLIVRSPQALEPVRFNNRIRWRVDDRCVEIDAATWHARRMTRERYDWSSQPSYRNVSDVRPEALRLARQFLEDSGEARAADLAKASDAELLRRLNVVTEDGYLSNAGEIAFVGRLDAALDYVRRSFTGSDSVRRIRAGGRSLLEEIADVEEALDSYNDVRQVRRGLVVGMLRDLPPGAVREAMVNGVVHRDWASAAPTTVEHIGRRLVVTSPGGFVGGVRPSNIITHPSQPRNRALAELFAALRLAEREGIGVDRMVRDMVSVGYPEPDIVEIEGPHVRAALVGERMDEGWITFLSRLEPRELRTDLGVLLTLRRMVSRWWIDVTTAAPILQLRDVEARGVLSQLGDVTVAGDPVIAPVAGVPIDSEPAWRITQAALTRLGRDDAEAGTVRRSPSRPEIAVDWARSRGRISSTELASIVGAHASNVGSVLRALEEQGELIPSRPNRRGPGFFYRPAPDAGPRAATDVERG